MPRTRQAGALLLTRLVLVALATLAAWAIVDAGEGTASFPPTPMLASLSLLPVNVVCLVLTSRLLRAEGRTLRSLFAPHGGWAREIGWGFLWIAVLYVPFVLAVLGTMAVLHGGDTFTAFETVFYDPDAASVASPGWALALGIVAVLTFVPLNAPAEEAVYRGYAQTHLGAAWPTALAVGVCSLVFGLQHAFFAPTADAMVVYVVAFTVWGIGSGLIVLRQGRLLPVTISHVVVNLMTSSPAVVFPALQLAGVVEG
ncbi:CPBP family intramembrane glutamic endopeptidase [Sanguibacter suaedae]|uniref:CPBP family intramembrane metalloprotease n=1 Tax=Sanguibacter suaedae TaxID=2795737 RepID=A0A934I5K5_9MICO|nr:CPBP family intramembrane glutamic endopeptidase [Sanguibacter suaedae]MBI9115608.1 CPBP family intramembrane metalloprotease [Sanguibacter suaedae]